MPETSPITIVNIGYLSPNYWVVNAGQSRLLMDLGYPGTLGTLRARLKQTDIPLKEICYALATHYHIDHAGLAQELKIAGVRLLVLDIQVAAIPLMKQFTKPQNHYVDISLDGNVIISATESRALLSQVGIPGEILPTPGHSADSVSLLLDNGSVFTGDLPPFEHAWGEAAKLVAASWHLLMKKGAKRVYPAHGPVRSISPIFDQSSQDGSLLT